MGHCPCLHGYPPAPAYRDDHRDEHRRAQALDCSRASYFGSENKEAAASCDKLSREASPMTDGDFPAGSTRYGVGRRDLLKGTAASITALAAGSIPFRALAKESITIADPGGVWPHRCLARSTAPLTGFRAGPGIVGIAWRKAQALPNSSPAG